MSILYRLVTLFCIFLIHITQSNGQEFPTDRRVYFLQNVATKQFMQVDEDRSSGSRVYQSTQTNAMYQKFAIDAYDNGTFSIAPMTDEMDGKELVFSVKSGGVSANPNGTSLILQTNGSSTRTQWNMENTNQPLVFIIRSADTKKVIGVNGNTQPDIIQSSIDASKDARFQWRIMPEITESTYVLRNRSTGSILDVPASVLSNGTKVSQKSGVSKFLTNQKFEISQVDEENTTIFSISPTHSKGTKFLDNAKLENEQLQIWKSEAENDHVKWQLLDVSENYKTQFVVIQSVKTKRILGVNSASDTRVLMFNENLKNDPRFQWELVVVDEETYVAEGRYQIVNKATKKVWEIPDAAIELNTVVRENANKEQENQQFDVTVNDNGQYVISPVHSRGTRYIVVDGTSKSANINGTALRTWNSQHPASAFDIVPIIGTVTIVSDDETDTGGVDDNEEMFFGIRSVFSGLDVGVHNHSGKTEIMQWAYNWKNDDRFLWSFEPVYQEEEVTPGKYIIQNVSTGKVFDVAGWGITAGTKVIQWPYASKTNQQFDIQPNGLGYTLRPLHTSNMYLNVCNCTNLNNSPLTIWSPSWEIERFMFDVVDYDQNGLPLYGIRSLFSNLNIGVHSSDNPNVMQWNVHWGVENDTRFQWRILKVGSPNAREVAMQSPSTELSSLIEPQLEVYPNPAIQDFSVKIGEFNEQEDLSITIADAMGKVVLQKSIGKERELNFNAASLGLKETNYIIHISNGSGKRVSKILRRE